MTAGLLFYYFIRVAEVTYTNQQRLFVPKTLCESPSQKKKITRTLGLNYRKSVFEVHTVRCPFLYVNCKFFKNPFLSLPETIMRYTIYTAKMSRLKDRRFGLDVDGRVYRIIMLCISWKVPLLKYKENHFFCRIS